jgi:hypothetical protein
MLIFVRGTGIRVPGRTSIVGLGVNVWVGVGVRVCVGVGVIVEVGVRVSVGNSVGVLVGFTMPRKTAEGEGVAVVPIALPLQPVNPSPMIKISKVILAEFF